MASPSGRGDGGNDGVNQGLGDGSRDGHPNRLFGRRTVLRTSGAALAACVGGAVSAVAPAAASRDVTSGDGYEVWTVRGKEVYDLSDDEEFSNVLVDQTADGACLMLRAKNKSGWSVQNVGFLGVPQSSDADHLMNLAGDGVVENVFIDGRSRGGVDGTEMGAVRMKRSHDGHVEIRHTFVAGMGNNASYASSAGKNGGGNGTVVYENCYHRDNTPSNYRPGTKGSVIRNSVSIANDPEGLRGSYPFTGAQGCRGAWVMSWPDQRIENCAFYMSPDDVNPNAAIEARHFEKSDGPGVEVTVVDTGINADAPKKFDEDSEAGGYARIVRENVHDEPSVDVIEGGVPLSPEMAARGERGTPPELP